MKIVMESKIDKMGFILGIQTDIRKHKSKVVEKNHEMLSLNSEYKITDDNDVNLKKITFAIYFIHLQSELVLLVVS